MQQFFARENGDCGVIAARIALNRMTTKHCDFWGAAQANPQASPTSPSIVHHNSVEIMRGIQKDDINNSVVRNSVSARKDNNIAVRRPTTTVIPRQRDKAGFGANNDLPL